MEFQIEKNVPIPDRVAGRAGRYPWDDMEVNDSFFVPGRDALSVPKRKDGKKFRSAKRVEKDGDGKDVAGVRVWRVA